MKESGRGLVVAVAILAVLAGALAFWYAYRVRSLPAAFSQADETAAYWSQLREGKHTFGDPKAPHTLVVFTDYQCAVCRDYDLMLQDLVAAYPEEVRVVVRHNPLRAIHQYADAAANAAACGYAFGKFEELHRALFGTQDQLGVISWSHIASVGGITDTTAFADCITSRQYARDVAEDVRLADALRLRRSPSVILDGQLLGSTPNLEQIAERGQFKATSNLPNTGTAVESLP